MHLIVSKLLHLLINRHTKNFVDAIQREMKSVKVMVFFDLKQKTHCCYVQLWSGHDMLFYVVDITNLIFSFNMTKE